MIKEVRSLFIGIALLLVSILLAISFHLFDDHQWYWDLSYIYFPAGMFLSLLSGLAIGRSISRGKKAYKWAMILGATIGSIWLIGGLAGFGTVFMGNNYFSSSAIELNWNSYHGDYIVGMYNIRLLQLVILSGFIGGLFIKLGWKRHSIS